MTITIPADRMTLRELDVADCSPEYVAWLQDPVVNRYLETRHSAQTLDTVRAFVAKVRTSDNEFLFGMFLNEGGRHIGNIKVGPIHAHHGLADVSLFVGARDCWGQGFAEEAIRAISRFALRELKLRKLSASMYAENGASRRAFIKAGYVEEGLRRAHYWLNGAASDLVELGLLEDDLSANT